MASLDIDTFDGDFGNDGDNNSGRDGCEKDEGGCDEDDNGENLGIDCSGNSCESNGRDVVTDDDGDDDDKVDDDNVGDDNDNDDDGKDDENDEDSDYDNDGNGGRDGLLMILDERSMFEIKFVIEIASFLFPVLIRCNWSLYYNILFKFPSSTDQSESCSI